MIAVASSCGPMRCDLGVVKSFGHGGFNTVDHGLCVVLRSYEFGERVRFRQKLGGQEISDKWFDCGNII